MFGGQPRAVEPGLRDNAVSHSQQISTPAGRCMPRRLPQHEQAADNLPHGDGNPHVAPGVPVSRWLPRPLGVTH